MNPYKTLKYRAAPILAKDLTNYVNGWIQKEYLH